jgi:hypothetical protein
MRDILLITGGVFVGFAMRDFYTLAYTWWVLREPNDLPPITAGWDDYAKPHQPTNVNLLGDK